jgi:hypothetical protein
MKEQFDLVIGEDGSIEAIYQDGLAQALGAKTVDVKRASHVEFERVDDVVYGWTVRSAKDPSYAIGIADDGSYCLRQGSTVYFADREEALKQEVKFFWDIVKEKE